MTDRPYELGLGLLEAAPDAMIVADREGRVMLANTQAERLLGYSREELIGGPVEILLPEALREVHAHHRLRYFADPTPRPMGAGLDLVARRKDGSEFPTEISLSTVRSGPGLLVVAAIRDVSERRRADVEREKLKGRAERERLEAQLHQAQRLESLGQLAGGVAHDFNNLLAVISGYTAFVSEAIGAAAQGSIDVDWRLAQQDMEQITRTVARAAELTHQLLVFGRREIVHPRVLDLNQVVRQVEALLQRTLGEHIELVTSLEARPWPIESDPGQLEQVLMNLAVNARDAMPDGGNLTITTSNMTITSRMAETHPVHEPGRYVRLQVSDTGIGIPDEVLGKVFDPFFTTKRQGQGSGLGLATVYGIIAQAGGNVQISSEPGQGTVCTAYLPATDREPDLVPATGPDTLTIGDGETILVVEDQPALCDVVRRILTRNGYRVLAVTTGAEAVETARAFADPIDLLLTDVVMPNMSGKETAEKVIALRPDIKVLYISGYARPDPGTHGALDPDATVIEKPFSVEALLEQVHQALAGAATEPTRMPPGNATAPDHQSRTGYQR